MECLTEVLRLGLRSSWAPRILIPMETWGQPPASLDLIEPKSGKTWRKQKLENNGLGSISAMSPVDGNSSCPRVLLSTRSN